MIADPRFDDNQSDLHFSSAPIFVTVGVHTINLRDICRIVGPGRYVHDSIALHFRGRPDCIDIKDAAQKRRLLAAVSLYSIDATVDMLLAAQDDFAGDTESDGDYDESAEVANDLTAEEMARLDVYVSRDEHIALINADLNIPDEERRRLRRLVHGGRIRLERSVVASQLCGND